MTQERIKLDPHKGTLFAPKKVRKDKGKKKKGYRIRTLKKIWKLILDLK